MDERLSLADDVIRAGVALEVTLSLRWVGEICGWVREWSGGESNP